MLYETKAEYFTYKYSNNSKSKNNEEQFSWDFSDNELISFLMILNTSLGFLELQLDR